MRRFEVVVRTRVNGEVRVRTAEALAKDSIDAICHVVRRIGIDGPMTTSVKLATNALNGGVK